MTVIKKKVQYIMVKKGSYYFTFLKHIYFYFRDIWAAKKVIKTLHPLLVLPVNLWHDSWTERAAVSAYLKLRPPPEAQTHNHFNHLLFKN